MPSIIDIYMEDSMLNANENELAVLQLIIEAVKQIYRVENQTGHLLKLKVTIPKHSEFKTSNAETYMVVGESLLPKRGVAIPVFGDVVLWWNHDSRRLLARIYCLKKRYRIVAGDLRGDYVLHVWPDPQKDIPKTVEDLGHTQRVLIHDFTDLTLPVRVNIWLNNGKRHEGRLDHAVKGSLVVDIGYKVVTFDTDEVVAIWTIPDRWEPGSEV